ncbi:hypothetical protein H6G04_31095 [Calothrix membranacea FACHB-236]|nr:hypothetical protein [Calothrix membranacea FACHB-236]
MVRKFTSGSLAPPTNVDMGAFNFCKNIEIVMRKILTDEAIALLIAEDVPYFDLTTFGL